ncbi:MAG: FKBP-type peptidyl-prolyl cis-trans isomerase [Candidatus Liptonbacteria bacterium]
MPMSNASKAIRVVIFVLAAGLLVWGGLKFNKKSEDKAAQQKVQQEQEAINQQKQIMDKLKIEDVKAGTGVAAENGDLVVVHYTGTLEDGTKFDSSRDRGEPFSFMLGSHQVIPGWELGLVGMNVGGIRKLTIPPELAYGSSGYGPVPANATLNFEIELLQVGKQEGTASTLNSSGTGQ